MRAALVVGTRPEAIKVAPLIGRLREDGRLTVQVVSTGQHRAMLDQVLTLFGVVPDLELGLGIPGQRLPDLAARALESVGAALDQLAPDVVVVQGDTSTTFIGALAAFYREIPVVHLEAGLRSGDLFSPYPEEGNRTMITRISSLHLAPTEANARQILSEGISPSAVHITGNTVIDALHQILALAPPLADACLRDALVDSRPIVTVTAHRRESWGAPIRGIAAAVREIVRRHDVRVVWPLHGNAAIRDSVMPIVGGHERITLLEPLGYSDFVQLLGRSSVALSDSGGVQEEAPAIGCPVVVLRDVTERREAVESGAALLAGTDPDAIIRCFEEMLSTDRQQLASPYGDGQAARRSAEAMYSMCFGSAAPEPFHPKAGRLELR